MCTDFMSLLYETGQQFMKIGIIDADLIGRKKHRFPNLVCEKLSGYWKEKGAEVTLLMDYNHCDQYDIVYIPKVFTDTPVPAWVINDKQRPNNVIIGGTGFFFDKAPNLPRVIEHHMPDYTLYDEWIAVEKMNAEKVAKEQKKHFDERKFMNCYREYTDYSIGFLTRGCFRKCGFCVNQKYDHVFSASPLDEFYDPNRKKLCFLDDNFFGCPNWKELLKQVINTGKPFKFKQGLDERLLTDDKCQMLFSSRYDGDITFAFDKVEDYELIEKQLQLIRKYSNSQYIKFYVLVGYKGTDAKDIENAFKRIALLLKYGAIPYIMRFQNKNDAPWTRSKWRGLYISMARWCNQPSIIKKMSFMEFCERSQALSSTSHLCAPMKSMIEFQKEYPEIAKKYFNVKWQKYER